MKEIDTLTWLRNGASKTFADRFFDNFWIYWLVATLLGMLVLNDPALSLFKCFMIASGCSFILLLVIVPLAYYFLGIRYGVCRSSKYQSLFLRSNVRNYVLYRDELPAIKKRIIADYLDEDGKTVSPRAQQRLKKCEDRLRDLWVEMKKSQALLQEEQLKSLV